MNPYERIDELERKVKDLLARVDKLENRQRHAFGDQPLTDAVGTAGTKATSTLHLPPRKN